jgi:TIR domain
MGVDCLQARTVAECCDSQLSEFRRILASSFFARIVDTMPFRVFLSYSLDPAEMALAWRLQTLAAAHGIEMYVPHHGTAKTASVAATVQQAIDGADCVLAIITTAATQMVQNELDYALKHQKLVIPIVRTDLAGHPVLSRFPRLFTFSPWDNPGTVETQIVEFLKEQQLTKEKQQTIGALAALGLGLLVLFSLDKE